MSKVYFYSLLTLVFFPLFFLEAKIVQCTVFEEIDTKKQVAFYSSFHKSDYDKSWTLKKESFQQIETISNNLFSEKNEPLLILNESRYPLLNKEVKGAENFAYSDASLGFFAKLFRHNGVAFDKTLSPLVTLKQIDPRYYADYFDLILDYSHDFTKFQNVVEQVFSTFAVMPGVPLHELKNPTFKTMFDTIKFSFSRLKEYEERVKKVWGVSFSNRLKNEDGKTNEALLSEFLDVTLDIYTKKLPLLSLCENDFLAKVSLEVFSKLKVGIWEFIKIVSDPGKLFVDLMILDEIASTPFKRIVVFAGSSHIDECCAVVLANKKWKKINEYPLVKSPLGENPTEEAKRDAVGYVNPACFEFLK